MYTINITDANNQITESFTCSDPCEKEMNEKIEEIFNQLKDIKVGEKHLWKWGETCNSCIDPKKLDANISIAPLCKIFPGIQKYQGMNQYAIHCFKRFLSIFYEKFLALKSLRKMIGCNEEAKYRDLVEKMNYSHIVRDANKSADFYLEECNRAGHCFISAKIQCPDGIPHRVEIFLKKQDDKWEIGIIDTANHAKNASVRSSFFTDEAKVTEILNTILKLDLDSFLQANKMMNENDQITDNLFSQFNRICSRIYQQRGGSCVSESAFALRAREMLVEFGDFLNEKDLFDLSILFRFAASKAFSLKKGEREGEYHLDDILQFKKKYKEITKKLLGNREIKEENFDQIIEATKQNWTEFPTSHPFIDMEIPENQELSSEEYAKLEERSIMDWNQRQSKWNSRYRFGTNVAIDLESFDRAREIAWPHLLKAQNQSCIVLIGDTGVGKSTLMNALLYAKDPENSMILENETIKEQGRFGEREIHRENIRPKNWIRGENEEELFKVSNDAHHSCTQYPEVINSEGFAFCDCPGFEDSGGFQKEWNNLLLTNELLREAREVRPILVDSYSSVIGKKPSIINTFKTLFSFFEEDDVKSLSNVLIVLNKIPLADTSDNACDYAQRSMAQEVIFNCLQKTFGMSKEIAGKIANNVFLIDPLDRVKTGNAISIQELKDRVINATSILPERFHIATTRLMGEGINTISSTLGEKMEEYILGEQFDKAEEQLQFIEQLSQWNIAYPSYSIEEYRDRIEVRRKLAQEREWLKKRELYQKLENEDCE